MVDFINLLEIFINDYWIKNLLIFLTLETMKSPGNTMTLD